MKTSFCIIAYDQDYYLLTNLLEMLKNQTAAPDEIIIYISGISELSLPKQILIRDRIVPIYSIVSYKRTMQSVARNICSSIASYDIIIFFDIDDEPHPQKIEITKILFNKYQPDFMLHSYITANNNFQYINLNNLQIQTNLQIIPHNTNITLSNNKEAIIHHAHIAVKKNIFRNIRFDESPGFYRKEDGKFCQDLIQNKYIGIYCSEHLIVYTS